MEKRSRSKARKVPASKSPIKNKKQKPSQKRAPSRSRSRGRPKKTLDPKEIKISPRRSRSGSRSVTKRTESSAKVSNDKTAQPTLVLHDIYNDSSTTVRRDINELIRRSISRDLEKNDVAVRRSARLTVNNLKVSEWTSKSKSRETDLEVLSKKAEFGGSIGALFQSLFFAAFCGAFLLGCSREQCTFEPFHVPRNLRYYFNLEATGGLVAFFLLQVILSVLPIGRVVKQSYNVSYRSNGLLAAILTSALLVGLWYYKVPVTLAYDRHISLAVSSYILALLLSIALYVKARKLPYSQLNPFGNSGSVFYDFFMGREINPTLFQRINVKIVLLRFCIIGILSLNLLLALKAYDIRKEVSPTLAVSLGLYSLYLLDYLWFEESFASTFEASSEGVGLLSTSALLTGPFLATVIPRFVLQYRVELSVYTLIASSISFLVGYFVYRASNLQKAAFRKNPLDKAFNSFETISTSRGKRLLVSGWWGFVKHPNYLGDIILHWAWATTVGFTHAVPYLLPFFTTIFLLHRAARDDERCRQKYKDSWEIYSKRVPKRVIPAIY